MCKAQFVDDFPMAAPLREQMQLLLNCSKGMCSRDEASFKGVEGGKAVGRLVSREHMCHLAVTKPNKQV